MNFSDQQIQGLNAAYSRQQSGGANATDQANLSYAQKNGWTPSAQTPAAPTPAPTVPGAAPTAPATTPGATVAGSQPAQPSLEVKPGTFSASKLKDYYDNLGTSLKQQSEAYKSLQSYQAPDYQSLYNQSYTSQIKPLETQISDTTTKINAIDDSLRNIEQDVRNEIGGRASESIIRAEVARRAAPLENQRQSLVSQYNAFNTQRQQSLEGINTQLGLAEKTAAGQLSGLQMQAQLADNVVNTYRSLVDKGEAATQQEVDNFRQMFSTLLQQSPDIFKKLTPEEYALLQQGAVPQSVADKIAVLASEQKLKDQKEKNQIIGTSETGYYSYNPITGEKKLVINPVAAKPSISEQINALNSGYQITTNGQVTDPSKGIVNGFNISSYATDPNHETAIASLVQGMGQFQNLNDVQNYISKVAPNSPITADMVSKASEKYGVPWEMLVAMMQQDSSLGTAGKGARTFNPGNVGNDDSGNIRNYGSWQKGVDAVADWLSKHRAASQSGSKAADTAATIFSGTSSMKLTDVPTKDRNAVAQELDKLKQQAIASGDVAGMIRASAGGSAPSDAFKQALEKGINVVDQISDLQKNISSEATGPILGIIRSNNPYDTKAQSIKAQLQALVPNLARGVYGEVGVLTDQDVEQYSKTLPNLSSTSDVNRLILGATIRSVQRSLETKLAVQAGAGTDVSGLVDVYNKVKEKADSLLNSSTSSGQSSTADAYLDQTLKGLNYDSYLSSMGY